MGVARQRESNPNYTNFDESRIIIDETHRIIDEPIYRWISGRGPRCYWGRNAPGVPALVRRRWHRRVNVRFVWCPRLSLFNFSISFRGFRRAV